VDAAAEDDFRIFVRTRTPALLGTAYLLTGDRDTAEDLLQTALLRAYRHWARVRAGGDAEAYVRKVLVNQRISWWRRRRVVESINGWVPDLPAPGDDQAAFAERDALWQALRRLPPRTRAVLVLRYWDDKSEAETARLLGCSLGTVKSLASRGLRRMRDELGPAAGEPGRAGTRRPCGPATPRAPEPRRAEERERPGGAGPPGATGMTDGVGLPGKVEWVR
jgi:RNA polymerase sigma-70 factor (sigma-E family)